MCNTIYKTLNLSGVVQIALHTRWSLYLIFYFTKHTIIDRSYAGYTWSHVNHSTHKVPKKNLLSKLVWLKKTKINKFKYFSYTDINRTRENNWSRHYYKSLNNHPFNDYVSMSNIASSMNLFSDLSDPLLLAFPHLCHFLQPLLHKTS